MDHSSQTPLAWGFDASFGFYREPWSADLCREFGFDLWDIYYPDHFPDEDPGGVTHVQRHLDAIADLDAWCSSAGLRWIANLERSNGREHCMDDRGRDWFNRGDGRHFFLFPDELLARLGRCDRLAGLKYDEGEWMQISRHWYNKMDHPYMWESEGASLEDASDLFTAAARDIAEHHRRHGVALYTENVFPVLFHNFAAAGFIPVTKILKETWSPVALAVCMGAAVQYGREFWVTPDLWGVHGYLDHSAEEYRSGLLLAYHMGADGIYTENLDMDYENRGIGSLILRTAGGYDVTAHGGVAKWFRNEHVPRNPRKYTVHDLKPRVAIIRQPDTCWGQAASWTPDWLFGNEAWPSTSTTEAWLRIWHLLTRGVVAADAMTWHGSSYIYSRGGAYEGRPHQLFCPLDGVVVFDHKAEKKHFESAEVIFLTGIGVSDQTFAAVSECVRAGAVCVSLPHLLPGDLRPGSDKTDWVASDGAGKWISTQDFLAPHVRKHIRHVIPEYDRIRYRFGETEVNFRPIDGDMDRIRVD